MDNLLNQKERKSKTSRLTCLNILANKKGGQNTQISNFQNSTTFFLAINLTIKSFENLLFLITIMEFDIHSFIHFICCQMAVCSISYN